MQWNRAYTCWFRYQQQSTLLHDSEANTCLISQFVLAVLYQCSGHLGGDSRRQLIKLVRVHPQQLKHKKIETMLFSMTARKLSIWIDLMVGCDWLSRQGAVLDVHRKEKAEDKSHGRSYSEQGH
jgi:hypothetical protein